ncbi:hypothetical protein [Cohnella sp. 56]
MDEETPVWAKMMADPPYAGLRFTPQLKQHVVRRTDEAFCPL